MKTLLLIVGVFTFTLTSLAQGDEKTHQGFSANNGIDFIILEMKIGAILGGYKDGNFVNAKTASKGLKIGEDYTLFGLEANKNNGILKVVKKHDVMEDICPEYVSVKTDSKANSGVALSSNARWNPFPRVPKSISSNNKIYRRIVRKYIQSKGIKKPKVEIKKILKVDLEGDGKDEVIIHASNRKGNPGYRAKYGEYSFILVRKIVTGKVKNIFLQGEFIVKNDEHAIQNNVELSSILDLDSDGKMEIVLNGGYYEGYWSQAFKIGSDGKPKLLLETGCGV